MQLRLAPILAIACALVAASPAKGASSDALLAPRSACPGQLSADAPSGTQERAMRCLINYARRQRGLPSLPRHGALTASARIKTHRVLACRDYAHRPCGDPLLRSFALAGYKQPGRRIRAEEDLNWGDRTDGDLSPRGTMAAWLASPPHRAAILGRHCEQGVARTPGVFDGERGVVWVAQFGCRY